MIYIYIYLVIALVVMALASYSLNGDEELRKTAIDFYDKSNPPYLTKKGFLIIMPIFSGLFWGVILINWLIEVISDFIK